MPQVSSKSLGVIVRINGENVIKNFLKVGDKLPHVSSMDFSVDTSLLQRKISIVVLCQDLVQIKMRSSAC